MLSVVGCIFLGTKKAPHTATVAPVLCWNMFNQAFLASWKIRPWVVLFVYLLAGFDFCLFACLFFFFTS